MTAAEVLAWAHQHLPTDPVAVVSAMEAAGWVKGGGRTGVYVRMGRVDDDRPWVLVPINPEFADYPDLMAAVLADLKAAAEAGRRAQQVLDALTRDTGREVAQAADDNEGDRP